MIATIALLLIAAAAVLEVVFLFARRGAADPASPWILAAAAVLLLVVTMDRSIRIRFVAVTNTYESLVFFAAVICILVFVLRLTLRERLPAFVDFGATLIALILLMVSSSPMASREIQPPIPALQSLWLVLHVTFSFIGEAFFAVGFVATIFTYFGVNFLLSGLHSYG